MSGTERTKSMAYNNGFPIGYQPYYPQAYQAPQQPSYASQGQSTNGIIWVQGEAGAKSYLVAPNTTVQLWDSENQVIYLKSADASGMPSMKILDYKIRDMQNQPVNPVVSADYVTRDELTAFEEQIKRQISQIRSGYEQSVVSTDGKQSE